MLKLIKKGDKYWLFEDSQIGLFSPSKFTINLELNEIVIVYENGLKSKRYNVSDCEIYDLGELTPFTTSSGDLFMQKLEELNCPCFQKNENIFNISGGAWGDITGNLSNQTDLQTALDSKLNKDIIAGVERAYIINADGSQGTKATSEFKDVLEFANLSAFPATGESGKIYIALDTNFTYRWSGSAYVKIAPIDPTLGTQFKKKSEAAAYNDPTLSGSDAVIPLQPNGQSVYTFSNAGLTSIDGFGFDLITGNTSAEVPYDGKDILIYNNKAGNLTLKHDGSGTADVKFLLEGSVDLVIPAGGKVWLKYGPSYCEIIFKSWTDIDLSSKADLVGGKVPVSQLPAYVDDVLEFANLSSFPTTGESGKIYIAIDTNLTYRWGGSSYVVMSSSLALGETSSTAYRGDRGNIAYGHSQTTGNPHNTTKSHVGLGSVDNTSDADKPISTATQGALNNKQDRLQDVTGNIGVGKPDASATEKLEVNGNVKATQIKDPYGTLKAQRCITITGNTTLSETHNGAVLNVTNTCNITIPTGLDSNFQCVIFAKGSIVVTFVNSGVTIYAPSGLLLKTDKMASLICTSTNNYNLTGELATS